MRGSVKSRLVLPVLLAALLALAVAGCGGGSDSGGGGDSAELAPPKVPLFIDFVVQPEGQTKANIEALSQSIAGVDLGELIASELEKSAAEKGESFDFEKEVQPWLGAKGGFFGQEYDGEDFHGYGVALEVSDEGEAQAFVEKMLEKEDEKPKSGSYEGVDFQVEAEDGTAVGVFDGFLVIAEDEAVFKQMVDASEGESLADEGRFNSAIGTAPSDSAADVYVDIGGLIKEAGQGIDAETQLFLDTVGLEPEEATAVASAVPGSDHLEIDFSTDVVKENGPSGDASEMLGSLPGDSVAAFASPEFGKRFTEALDQLDETGIPGQVPPHQLKKALKQPGVDLESITGTSGDLGLFVEGSNRGNLEGALVLETEDPKQASNTVSNLGLFLKAAGTPGVTQLSGEEATGFIIHSAELGPRPAVVAAKGNRIAIGYGARSVPQALSGKSETLAENPHYEEAVSALGGTPISGFVDGPAALKLAAAMVPPGDEGFRQAKRYLTKIDDVAIGSESGDGLAKAKLIVGVGK
jgi:hypothetical protein